MKRSVFMLSAATMLAVAKREGMVEHVGAQRDVFKTGKAASVVSSFSAATRECNKIYS